jgi:hypothetical protein
MDENRFVHGLDQTLEELLAIVQPRPSLLQTLEQLIDGGTEQPERRGLAFYADASRGSLLARELRHLTRQLAYRAFVTPLPPPKRTDTRREDN